MTTSVMYVIRMINMISNDHDNHHQHEEIRGLLLAKPNKNLLWDTWYSIKVKLTLNQSRLPLQWRS